jgi:hypothetical protein
MNEIKITIAANSNPIAPNVTSSSTVRTIPTVVPQAEGLRASEKTPSGLPPSSPPRVDAAPRAGEKV